MYIYRSIENLFPKLEKMFSAILITGPRRVGKTTLLENTKKNIEILNFDDSSLRESAINSPNSFFKDHEFPLALDEIQRVPQIFLQLKYEIDKTKKKAQVYMTGSQSFVLMKNVSESLSGRIGILQLLGLTQREKFNIKLNDYFLPTDEYINNHKNIKIDYNTIWEEIIRGGSPELFIDKSYDKNIFLSNYVDTYIERDVRDLTQIGDVLKFAQFMKLVASQIGSILNLSNISRDLNISVPTCQKYLSILVSSHIVYLLKPYSNYLSKRLIKTPKVYFLDTGLACHLLKWNTVDTLKNGAMAGHMFENYVISEIIKSYYNCGNNDPELYYYRDKDQKEIDLLILENGILYPIEIKKHADPSIKDITSFSLLKKYTNIKIGDGAVISFYENPITISDNVHNIPVSYL